MTAVLGGIATLVASYLARVRGTNEPELSTARAKDLEKFIRKCEAYMYDHGRERPSDTENDHNHNINELRQEFEQLLGNASSG